MKKTFHFLCVLCFVFTCAACETQSTVNTSLDVIEDADAVVVGPVDAAGATYLRLPASLFDSSSAEVNGSTANLYLNGGLVLSAINLADYVHEDGTVRFSFNPVVVDDVLGIQITFSTSATVYYEGTIGDEAESELLLSVM